MVVLFAMRAMFLHVLQMFVQAQSCCSCPQCSSDCCSPAAGGMTSHLGGTGNTLTEYQSAFSIIDERTSHFHIRRATSQAHERKPRTGLSPCCELRVCYWHACLLHTKQLPRRSSTLLQLQRHGVLWCAVGSMQLLVTTTMTANI